jgi:hypothetical protein
MRLVSLKLTDRVLVNFIADDSAGWRFGSWMSRSMLTRLPIEPTDADRNIRFDDPQTAMKYFQSHYGSALREHFRLRPEAKTFSS